MFSILQSILIYVIKYRYLVFPYRHNIATENIATLFCLYFSPPTLINMNKWLQSESTAYKIKIKALHVQCKQDSTCFIKTNQKNNHMKIHTYIVHQHSYEYGGLGQST